MTQRGVLSPRRQDATTKSSFSVGMSDTEPVCCPESSGSGTLHARARPPSTLNYLVLLTVEGFLSFLAFYSALAVAMPIMPAMHHHHAAAAAAAGSDPHAGFPAHFALRSGAALALGVPFFLFAARCAILALGRLRTPEMKQPQLGFPLPAELDQDAMLDLYVIGLGAGVLGIFVPGLEVLGSLLGAMLKGSSALGGFLALLAVIPGVYLVVGALEGFSAYARPTRAIWGLCAAGHAVFLGGCFYSPDIERLVGFSLGLVHIVRLLQQVFLYPGNAGAAACGEMGVVGEA